MVFATLFPLGVIQLYHSVSSGYFDARTLQFITGGANPVLEWLRLPGRIKRDRSNIRRAIFFMATRFIITF
jgi:nitric oxide reductase large subunit